MYVKEICKPLKEVESYFPRHWGPPPTPLTPTRIGPYNASDLVWQNGDRYLRKFTYEDFLKREVYGRYDVGTYVTFASTMYVPGQLPGVGRAVYRVYAVQEVWLLAPIDPNNHQPRCINLEDVEDGRHITYVYPPAALRRLCEEELTLVNLRNQKRAQLEASLAEASRTSEQDSA